MPPDPLTAALDQLAAHHDRITQLDAREAEHYATVTGRLTELTDLAAGIGQTLRAHQEALVRLEDLDRQGADVTAPPDRDSDHYRPGPAPAWWRLTAAERQEPVARLRSWVEHVYRPGYGHLAATLGPCWASHDLCLYGLDILSSLWSVLYLQPRRTSGLLSAQAEYQARILPALADQLRLETSRCGHPRNPGPATSHARTAS